jgi:hypothetical protein
LILLVRRHLEVVFSAASDTVGEFPLYLERFVQFHNITFTNEELNIIFNMKDVKIVVLKATAFKAVNIEVGEDKVRLLGYFGFPCHGLDITFWCL